MTQIEELEAIDKEIEKLEQELYLLRLRKERINSEISKEFQEQMYTVKPKHPYDHVSWGNSRLEDGGSDYQYYKD